MLKKTLIIIVAFTIIAIINSCCTEEYEYKWTDFKIDIIDNTGKYPTISTQSKLNKKALGFRIVLQDSVMMVAQNFQLLSQCYATTCAERYTRTHNLSSIRIKTLFKYSNKYPKNSDITDLFMAREHENQKGLYISLKQIISKINGSTRQYDSNTSFDLFLMDTNALNGLQRFEIDLEMSDGDKFTHETDTLTLF